MKTRPIIRRDLPVKMPPNRCTPPKCFQKIRLKSNWSTTVLVVPIKKFQNKRGTSYKV